MDRRTLLGLAGATAITAAIGGCSSTASTATSLFNQLGGMETVSKLGSNLLSSAMKDPRLTSLLGQVNPAVAAPKVNNQLCSALGGGCSAPFSDDQLTAAANKLTPAQKTAVSENFASSLASVASNPAVREAVTTALGPKLGGIVGALL